MGWWWRRLNRVDDVIGTGRVEDAADATRYGCADGMEDTARYRGARIVWRAAGIESGLKDV